MNPHLTDDTLNEYLDRALMAPACAEAEAHLAGCAGCAGRLRALAALAASLDTLPEAPLRRDLRLGVMAAVRARQPTAPRPVTPARRPIFWVVFTAQALVALALLAFAWPFLTEQLVPVTHLVIFHPTAPANPLAGGWPDLSGLWLGLQVWLSLATAWPIISSGVFFNPVAVGLALLVAGAGWLLGNSLLLRQRPAPRLRRHS